MDRGLIVLIIGIVLAALGLSISGAAVLFAFSIPLLIIGAILKRKAIRGLIIGMIYDEETGECHGCGATGVCGSCKGTGWKGGLQSLGRCNCSGGSCTFCGGKGNVFKKK